MTQRRSPKLGDNHTANDVRRAIDTLEDRPRIPEGTPASSAADGFSGEIKMDDSYLYLRTRGGTWKRIALSAF